jgi:D-alanine transaminase
MEALGYYNGKTGPLETMMVPMNDRASWFGDGVYDAALAANRVIFALDEHIDRFYHSAAQVFIEPPLSKQALADLLRSLVPQVDSPSQLVYWQLTRGTAPRSHAFPEGAAANLWITLRHYPLADIRRKVKLITAEDIRFFLCHIKTLNLLPNVLASEQAKQAGCDEAVFHRGDRVTECAHSNVHILQDGVFRTAPTDNQILPGIARAHLIAQCKRLGVPVDESPFTLAQLFDADEMVISSSGNLCAAASHLDGRAVGGRAPALLGKLQDALEEEFLKAVGLAPAVPG